MRTIQLPEFLTLKLCIAVNVACTMWSVVSPSQHLWVNILAVSLQQVGIVFLTYTWGKDVGFERGITRAVQYRFQDAQR
jgi:hypothetical protein